MPGPKQRTAEWREARRGLITSTDLPVILGISPYKSEGQLAREKLGLEPDPTPNLAMQIGQAMEPVIKAEYERVTGYTLTRYQGYVIHRTVEWAAASPDYRRKGQRFLVEAKDTRSRRWRSGELPWDVQAQVVWQLGCTGFPRGHVAALEWGQLRLYDVEYDQVMFDNLVVIAADFRQRMVDGGPFNENLESVKSKWPTDDGSEMVADTAMADDVTQLLELRKGKAEIEAALEVVETRIKDRMATATKLVGPGWHATWKRTSDSEVVDWKTIAEGFLAEVSDEPRANLIRSHTTIRPGSRPFRVWVKGNDE